LPVGRDHQHAAVAAVRHVGQGAHRNGLCRSGCALRGCTSHGAAEPKATFTRGRTPLAAERYALLDPWTQVLIRAIGHFTLGFQNAVEHHHPAHLFVA
jgi:hypothetical protein